MRLRRLAPAFRRGRLRVERDRPNKTRRRQGTQRPEVRPRRRPHPRSRHLTLVHSVAVAHLVANSLCLVEICRGNRMWVESGSGSGSGWCEFEGFDRRVRDAHGGGAGTVLVGLGLGFVGNGGGSAGSVQVAMSPHETSHFSRFLPLARRRQSSAMMSICARGANTWVSMVFSNKGHGVGIPSFLVRSRA